MSNKDIIAEVNLAEGIWLVTNKGKSLRRISKLGEIPKPLNYAKLAIDGDDLASFIHTKIKQYFDISVVFYGKGKIKYTIPSASDIANDILKYLSLTKAERKKIVQDIENSIRYIDSEGNIRDGSGCIMYRVFTPQAILYTIEQLKEDIKEQEKLLGYKVVDEL